MKIIGACLEDCVHVAGILGFLSIAKTKGHETIFLGPATSTADIIRSIEKNDPDIVGISYRLTPTTGEDHVQQFLNQIKQKKLESHRYFIGCLPELAKNVRKMDFFEAIFEGGEGLDTILPLLDEDCASTEGQCDYPDTLLSRIKFKSPYPVIRAHFGLNSMEDTLKGICELSNAEVLDIISIAPDQACQTWLNHLEILKSQPIGAGGAPIRSRQDLISLYEKSQTGNYPLLRIYSGTQDLVENGSTFQDTIHNAWAAIPVFWYSQLDGRGPKPLPEAIEEHLDAIRWHAEHNIPVEINDPHQWGLRMAPDHLVVADAYLSAKIAKELGVRTYIEQLMFNTPTGNTWQMDLARALAMVEIVEPLIIDGFKVLRETRAGLAYLSPNETVAKGQLCASTLVQMAVKPHILHVVTHSEGSHAAKPEDIIESVNLVKPVITDSIRGLPDMTLDPAIQAQKAKLLVEARCLLDAAEKLGSALKSPNWILDPMVLTQLVTSGLWDAPQLVNNPWALGRINVRIEEGIAYCVDDAGSYLSAQMRSHKILTNQHLIERPTTEKKMEVV